MRIIKFKFKGKAFEFIICQIGLTFLSVITFGLATPYWFYWTVEYFIKNTTAVIKND